MISLPRGSCFIPSPGRNLLCVIGAIGASPMLPLSILEVTYRQFSAHWGGPRPPWHLRVFSGHRTSPALLELHGLGVNQGEKGSNPPNTERRDLSEKYANSFLLSRTDLRRYVFSGSLTWLSPNWQELLDQGSANHGSWPQFNVTPVFINNILLEYSHVHLFTHCLWPPSGYRSWVD